MDGRDEELSNRLTVFARSLSPESSQHRLMPSKGCRALEVIA
jgi:hypothetical protein